jgi:pSer/pThr/pTyr-binding forkhead associated (FHA) protein
LVSTVLTSPKLAPSARLVLVGRDGNEGLTYPLGESTDIGRTEGAVLLGEDRYISPRHARIAFRTGSYFLRDLGSTNGVFFRIPFRGGLRSEAPEAAAARGPRRGPGPQRPSRPNNDEAKDEGRAAANSSDSAQPLEDQDLFLVGQQVLRFEVVKDAEEGFGVASDNGTLLFGTPAMPRFARLAQRTVEGVVRDVFNIRKAETVLGRESGDIVFPDDPFLSRRHAVVRVHGTETRAPGPESAPRTFTLSDLGSSNGTFLKIHAEIPLRHGDHFRIGQQLFRFDLDGTKNGA